jgi:AmmeMemoRadiSam system protein A
MDEEAAKLLSEEDKQFLLRLARQALECASRGEPPPPISQDTLPRSLQEPRATFVTLTRRGALRGCIGALQAAMPLADDVREHAVAAAVEDFRFSPVRPDEVSSIEIEISVLTPPRPLRYELVDELLGKLRPGIDGVILESGYHRATFLPQVWDKVPDPEAFLGMLCEKAGLAYDAWRKGDLRVSTYQVESFHEHPRPVS